MKSPGIGSALATMCLLALPFAVLAQQSESATASVQTGQSDSLVAGFQNPGEAARPRVWWHWMNGNITWDGVQKDMDWMERVGIAGMQAFDAGMTTPQVVEERLPYMTDGWKDVFRKTAANADRLGLEFGVVCHAVFRRDSLQRYSAEAADDHRCVPDKYCGRNFGRSRAWPEPAGILCRPEGDRIPRTSRCRAAHSNNQSERSLPAAKETGGISWIQFDFGRTVVVRGLTLATPIAARLYSGIDVSGRNGAPPVLFKLEASDDGTTWQDTSAKIQTGTTVRTCSVDSVAARYFRFVSIKQAPLPPSPPARFEGPQQPPPESIPIQELALRGEATVHSFEEKAAFFNNDGYYKLPSGTAGTAAAIKTADEIDLTSKMGPDGQLDWTPPAGNWMVLRIGYSLTGAMNRPASPEATGLEVDKLDAAAIKRYMDHYLSMYRDASGGLMGPRGLRAMMFDSWESANTNWTPLILADFKSLRAMIPLPGCRLLPAT